MQVQAGFEPITSWKCKYFSAKIELKSYFFYTIWVNLSYKYIFSKKFKIGKLFDQTRNSKRGIPVISQVMNHFIQYILALLLKVIFYEKKK